MEYKTTFYFNDSIKNANIEPNNNYVGVCVNFKEGEKDYNRALIVGTSIKGKDIPENVLAFNGLEKINKNNSFLFYSDSPVIDILDKDALNSVIKIDSLELFGSFYDMNKKYKHYTGQELVREDNNTKIR